MTDAAKDDEHLAIAAAYTLDSAGALDAATRQSLVTLLVAIAQLDDQRIAKEKAKDNVTSALEGLKTRLNDALAKLAKSQASLDNLSMVDTLGTKMDAGFQSMQNQINSLSQQVVAWQKYNTSLGSTTPI